MDTDAKLHPLYETGRLDLSPEEIGREENAINSDIRKRHPKTRFILFRNQTPQEIHRLRVLSAMRMAQSCLIYGETWKWEERYSKDFTGIWFFGESIKPYYRGTKVQREAYALTKAEVDAVFSAQKNMLSHYRVHQHVFTDSEGVTYNSLEKLT